MADIPQLFEIIHDDNQLQLSPPQLQTAVEQSRRYWYNMTKVAMARYREGILPPYANPRYMLGRVPAICEELRHMLIPSDSNQGRVLYVEGFSSWKVDDSPCGEKIFPGSLLLGSQKAVPCRLSGEEFSRWPGTGNGKETPNYVGVLALGWSYILSVRLGEIIGSNAVTYTSSAAIRCIVHNEDVSNIHVDIGEVTEDAYHWWAAILAPFEGWKATIVCQDQEYLAPWSISVQSSTFCIRGEVNSTLFATSARDPPSSSEAFGYLCQFSLRHNLGSQLLIALTTAMTFPTHGTHDTIVSLPLVVTSDTYQPNALATSFPPEWKTLEDELPYYMAFSCNTDILISSLCGMFWQPEVTCDLVSPWLHPILNEVPLAKEICDTPGLYHELLGIICSFRQPQISSLWLGAVASGLTPVILRRVRRARPPLEPNAFPWTGCPQSFMDVAGTGPYLTEGAVQRADVWRLLHLPPVVEDDLHYHSRPLSPWAPPGSMADSDCALRVRSHLYCERHVFRYVKWTWKAEGISIEDQGFSNDIPPFHQHDQETATLAVEFPVKVCDQEASEEASREIFRWVVVNGEGVPHESIYKDDWLKYDADDDDDDDDDELPVSSDNNNSESSLRDERKSKIYDWMLGLPASTKHAPLDHQ